MPVRLANAPLQRRVARRPFSLQPVVRPPSLTHLSQVGGGSTVKNSVNAKLRAELVQVVEEAPPAAEEHWGQRNF